MANDVRDDLFKNIINKRFSAVITAEDSGILAGVEEARKVARDMGLRVEYCLQNGYEMSLGERIMVLSGTPKQIAKAEEVLIGLMSMASGIATAARKANLYSDGKIRVVAGAWKKMPPDIKQLVRHAITTGGGRFRITDKPFIYIDKNYVRMFGGVQEALTAVKSFENMCKCIQLKGEYGKIEIEAEQAVRSGADIVMVDTGLIEDVERVIAHLKLLGLRDKVQIAFGKGVLLKDISALADKGIDILDIGLQIIDAPLLDMKLDVVAAKKNLDGLLEVNLFEKTELWINGIYLKDANLTNIAEVIAQTLKIDRNEVLVVDVQDSSITIDILKRKVNLHNIIGKEEALLSKLSDIDNVVLAENCRIHSDGILGVIAVDSAAAEKVLSRSQEMISNINTAISRRVKIFPTGFELLRGYIKDTNSDLIKSRLEKVNFVADIGDILDDNIQLIAGKIKLAVEEGYGVVITTGGTGAEKKDCTVEAVLCIDPKAATPYVVKFQKGCGRHVKNGVKIAVGEVNGCKIISLPGPTAEVEVALDIIIANMDCCGKTELAELIAARLRAELANKNLHTT